MKSNLDKFYKTNSIAETEGIWFNVGDDVRFRIKRFGGMNSQKVKAVSAKYFKPYSKLIQKGALPEEKEREIMVKTFVESSVVDWENVEIDGELVEYSHEACIKLLLGLSDLTDALIEYASTFDSFKEDMGNS